MTEISAMKVRHGGTKARRHEVVKEGRRQQVRTLHSSAFFPRPHSVPSCLLAFVPLSSSSSQCAENQPPAIRAERHFLKHAHRVLSRRIDLSGFQRHPCPFL